jgi:hypothetical protein
VATVITNAGLVIPSGRMIGTTPSQAEPKQSSWGTSAGTAAVGDTTLFGEKALDLAATSGSRVTGSSTQTTGSQTNDTYQVTATMTATGANTVTNAGLWDNQTIGSGTLYLKGDFTGIVLGIGDAIAFTYKVRYA